MKKTLTILLTAFAVTTAIGQITTTKVASKSDQVENTAYDSTQNFMGKDVNKYLGQELYLKGKLESSRKYGYDGFYTDYNKGKFDGGVYKCCDSYNSKYDELVGKYFLVLEIIKRPKKSEYDYVNESKKFYLKLREKASTDIVYFEYNSDYEHTFPFLVVGFFEKLKKLCIGQSYVFGAATQRYENDKLDISTGNPIVFTLGSKWECTDITIEEKYYTLSLILKNKNEQKMTINYDMVVGPKKFYDFFTTKEADKYKNKFGVELWNTILQGKVRIGMTKEMCKLSWGEPKDINETILAGKKSEQWVYSDNYLYFDNGILTAKQQ
jgi:hypothetical protein